MSSNHLPSGLLYCIGSTYRFGNLFWNSWQGRASTLPVNIFGHFVGTIAKCLAGICTGREIMILSSVTACDAIAITSPLYSANLLLSSVHPNLKQWWLRKSSPRIKGLVIPLHTMNLCVKLHGPIWKLTSIDPFTPTSWPFAVLIQVLLSKIWCKSSISDTVSYLMQLTCATVSKRDEKARSFTLILKVVPFVLPVFITNTSFSTVLLLTSSVFVVPD